MVSALWNACSTGDAEAVRALLAEVPAPDIELKDQFGVTALIEAVRNGHMEIVKALLEKGADAGQGPAESYTTDGAMLDVLLRFKGPAVAPPVAYPFYNSPIYAAPGNAPEGGIGNLPPPDVARFIPCRYFPACRYGSSCMFAHPQQYYPGPPAPYVPPYDPIQHYNPNYFPPPPFQPNPVHPPPPADIPFSPAPYAPMSPNAYPHPAQTPVPIMMPPPAPHYPNPPSAAPPYPQPDPSAFKPNGVPQEFTPDAKQDPNPRDGPNHRRGGRRPSFNGRKPPCLFFPAGRCKNGDECRWPHVTPEANAPHHVPYFSARGPKPPRHPHGNGINNITDKMGNLGLRDDAPAHKNGAEGSSRSQSTDPSRPRYHQGGKNGYGQNGARAEKRPPPPPKQQRVPNADEFPVLGGTNTPPTRNGLSNGHTGPTAAQVLSAPAPFRSKESSSKDSSTRGPSPDVKSAVVPKPELNGMATAEAIPAPTTHDHPAAAKLPVSFAAVAAPELPKEIALSA